MGTNADERRGRRESVRVVNWITRREDVAGIQADAEPLRFANAGAENREVLEPVAEASPLPRGRFHKHLCFETSATIRGDVQAVDDPLQPGFIPDADVGAGVHHEVSQAELLGPFPFDDECVDRFLKQLFARCGEVDEVRIVSGQ